MVKEEEEGEEVQGAPQSEERSLSNCCLMSCQLLHLNLSGSFLLPVNVANLNPEKEEDLVVVKRNSRLLKSMGFIRK